MARIDLNDNKNYYLDPDGQSNEIYGHGGDDTIFDRGGDDEVYGGDGDDLLQQYPTANIDAPSNNDSYWGGNGDDRIFNLASQSVNAEAAGEAGDDVIVLRSDSELSNLYADGGSENDQIELYGANLEAAGGSGDDLLAAVTTFDTGAVALDGGEGVDALQATIGSGVAALDGGTGGDDVRVSVTGGNAALDGGDGSDTLYAVFDDVIDPLDPNSPQPPSGATPGNATAVLLGGSSVDKLTVQGVDATNKATLQGGLGGDEIHLNNFGPDTVVYGPGESTVQGTDSIYRFDASEGDKIDLSAIDANKGEDGNQEFAWMGVIDPPAPGPVFDPSNPGPQPVPDTDPLPQDAGQLWAEDEGNTYFIYGQTVAGGDPELKIALINPVMTPDATDFIL